jgi:hypothetical protein
MRLREARDVRQHGGRKVSALDAEMVEHLRKPVGHRKIRFCCHLGTVFIRLRTTALIHSNQLKH